MIFDPRTDTVFVGSWARPRLPILFLADAGEEPHPKIRAPHVM